MRIKKQQDKNEYILTPDRMWVRNFTKDLVPYIDKNKTASTEDHFIFLKNEFLNGASRIPWIDSENLFHENIIIVSDGFDFDKKHKILSKIPSSKATVIGVHGSLKKWKEQSRNMNYYLVNNPYEECLNYLPRVNKILPKCILSNKTNNDFVRKYRGTKYRYAPVDEIGYSGPEKNEITYQIDDHRNAICAALNLSYRFGANKILLLCCDDSFEQERPGAEKLHNNLWCYPQQRIANGIIDGILYWIKNSGLNVEIKNHSSGPIYKNAEYIDEDKIVEFFEE